MLNSQDVLLQGLDPHHLQEDYIPNAQFGTDQASTPSHHSTGNRCSTPPSLCTAASVSQARVSIMWANYWLAPSRSACLCHSPFFRQAQHGPTAQSVTLPPAARSDAEKPRHRGSFSLLRTAALVSFPGLGSPGSTQVMMGDVLGGSMWERNMTPSSVSASREELENVGRLDSLEDNLLSPTSLSRRARLQ